MSVIKLSFT